MTPADCATKLGTWQNCKDCGGAYYPSERKFKRICPQCFALRLRVIEVAKAINGGDDFAALQASLLRSRNGSGRRAMEAFLLRHEVRE